MPSVSIFNRRSNIRKRRRNNSITTNMVKALFINGSPRNNGNTAQLLKRAMDSTCEAHKAEVRDTQFSIEFLSKFAYKKRN